MDKKSKEVLRRYKKARQAQSSSSSSSSDSDSSSYSSSESERKAAERHRKKKARHAAAAASARHSSSSSDDERRKREKREHCQKLEAKRNHLKRKLKEAKLKKRAAAAAAALSGHTHRALSPATQAKLKKLAERKHQRAASKECREREREKHRVAARERERDHHRGGSRSPTKITKIRIHQDVKRQKSPPRMHHQLMSREKIIIQTRTRERTPSVERERQRHEHKMRHHEELVRDRERREREREREAAREKERAEALARCQERQRERERLAREKLRREEEEKKYGGAGNAGGDRGERLLPRPAERELALAAARGYNSRERSLEAAERTRHAASKRGELEMYDVDRRGLLERDELRREREYLTTRRRDLTPTAEHYPPRLRDPRELYAEEERERVYSRAYLEEPRHPREREPWLDTRDLRERELHELREPREPREPREAREFRELEHDLIYPDDRECLLRERERDRPLPARADWKSEWAEGASRERDWHDVTPPVRSGFVGGPKRAAPNVSAAPEGPPKMLVREQRAPSEPDWDVDEVKESGSVVGASSKPDTPTNLRETSGFSTAQRELAPQREKRWTTTEWHENVDDSPQRSAAGPLLHHRSERGGRSYRRGALSGAGPEHGERSGGGFRPHPPPLMTLPIQPPGGYHSGSPRFPPKRNMTYTNPNLIKKQQAALAAAKAAAQASAVVAATTAVAAAKAAAQSAANATTNPSILGQVSGNSMRQHPMAEFMCSAEKPEAGEITPDSDSIGKPGARTEGAMFGVGADRAMEDKTAGELSEISDSDDDILNTAEKKSKTDGEEGDTESVVKLAACVAEQPGASAGIAANAIDVVNSEENVKVEEEEMLDFEEISDGELEEDARVKGVGDALGVDWASLIAETKRQAENAAPHVSEQPTSAKQKWQPHRVILDIGISMRMAGAEYAKRLISAAQQKLDAELLEQVTSFKTEIKRELGSTVDDDSQAPIDTDENTAEAEVKLVKMEPTPVKTEQKPNATELEVSESAINVDRLPAMACLQVAERKRQLERRRLIVNACGPNSRALSARQDLKLRRQLCGLPAQECDVPRSLAAPSEKMKAMILAAFQRTLEVK